MCLAAALAVLLVCLPAEGKHAPRRNKRQAAQAQYQTAQRMREALNGRPAKQRTKAEYGRVIEAYRRVYHYSPASPHAHESLLAMAELMAEEGRIFGDDSYFQKSIDEYGFLRREYPGSRYRFDALFTIGQIQWQDLGQPQQATQTFQEFLKSYPNHRLAEQARQAIADIQQEAKAAKAAKIAPRKKEKQEPKEEPEDQAQEAKTAPTGGDTSPERPSGPLPLVTSVRHWSTPDYTRVAIDLEGRSEERRVGKECRL